MAKRSGLQGEGELDSSICMGDCGLPESLALSYRKWFLDTLSVLTCYEEQAVSTVRFYSKLFLKE